MPIEEDERGFRLKPRKPPIRKSRNRQPTWATLMKGVIRHARMTRKARSRTRGNKTTADHAKPYSQRCAVRVMYSRNTVRGQWRAHGRYITREGTTHEVSAKTAGFDDGQENIDMSARLDNWQSAGDERMWKFILSPEFGDRVDLKRLTRDLMNQVKNDLGGSPLEWVAVLHYNTEHPHIHVALRGVDNRKLPFHLDRDYVKNGIRRIAENLCTQQLGYRTELDTATAERRELHQQRYTSLDRIISKGATPGAPAEASSQFFTFVSGRVASGIRDGFQLRQQHTVERLFVLQSMGLAQCIGRDTWHVRRDFESVLRAMQRMGDRQKTLAAHGVLKSDDRLPVTSLDNRSLKSVEGRVLVHGEEEAGRSYLMLEGTDARIHHISYTPEMEEARSRGGLRMNSFIRLRKLFVEGQPVMHIDDRGDAEAVLRNKRYLKETAQSLMRRGIIPEEDGWGGWLGRYQAAVRAAALEEMDRQGPDNDIAVHKNVKRSRSR